MTNLQPGDKVRILNEGERKHELWHYLKVGVMGEIVGLSPFVTDAYLVKAESRSEIFHECLQSLSTTSMEKV